MSAIDERPRLDERYASATRSTDLSPSAEHRTDADILLAAGYAAQKNRNGMVALMAYRMKITGDRASRSEIVELLVDMIAKQVGRRKLPSINRPTARVVAQTVVNWWSNDNCEVCTGRKMQPIPGTPHLSANWCEACAGLGKRAIPDVGARFKRHGDWLAAELDHMLTFIVGDMAKLINNQITGAIYRTPTLTGALLMDAARKGGLMVIDHPNGRYVQRINGTISHFGVSDDELREMVLDKVGPEVRLP